MGPSMLGKLRVVQPCAKHRALLGVSLSASTSPAPRALRQLRLPRRPTCPPLRSSSRRVRAIQSRPNPVRWSARRVAPSDEVGIGPQATDPLDQPARSILLDEEIKYSYVYCVFVILKQKNLM